MTRVQTIHRIEEEVVLEKQTQKWIQLIWPHTNNTVHTEYKNTPYIQISLKICPIEVSYICFFWTSVKHWKTPTCSTLYQQGIWRFCGFQSAAWCAFVVQSATTSLDSAPAVFHQTFLCLHLIDNSVSVYVPEPSYCRTLRFKPSHPEGTLTFFF